MNPLPILKKRIEQRFPEARVAIDRPKRATARGHLDASIRDYLLVVTHDPKHGFGLTTPTADRFGEGVDETFATLERAWRRVVELLAGKAETQPPRTGSLKLLRESLKLSQAELADRLHVQQAAVSRVESRNDMRLSTLKAFISAMGAELEVRALFPNGHVHQIDLRALEATD